MPSLSAIMHRSLFLAICFLASCTGEAPKPTDKGGSKPEPVKAEPAKEPTKVEPPKVEPPKSEPTTPPSDPAAGQVLGVMQTAEGLTLQVQSGGCRGKEGITFAVTAGKLAIATLPVDRCEAHIPLGASLLFPWAELPAFIDLGITLGAVPVLEPGTTAGAITAPAEGKEESLYGVLVTADGLDVRVSSGGCTAPEHFTAWIEPGEIELVHLVRTKPDVCEVYVAEGELLHFTWKQLGVTKTSARVVNPFSKLVVK